jgi:hypothetical protein
MPKKFTTEIFIQKAKEVHGDKYNYSKVNYINRDTKDYLLIFIYPIIIFVLNMMANNILNRGVAKKQKNIIKNLNEHNYMIKLKINIVKIIILNF